jgi:phosphate uptake regulator
MKRKIVKHGPTTLSVSLPADWVKEYGLKKGDEISIDRVNEGILISAGAERRLSSKTINVSNKEQLIKKAIAALYKGGYDEIVVEYTHPEELEAIHDALNTGFIGFEIVQETKTAVHIHKVSEPTQDEFRAIFRRIFHFLSTTAQESLEAARSGNRSELRKLIARDDTINKLTDFCRRVVNKRSQRVYQQHAALYHIIEQLEKIADSYKEINKIMLERAEVSEEVLHLYEQVNSMTLLYADLFFNFSLDKVDELFTMYRKLRQRQQALRRKPDEEQLNFLLQGIAREIYNLSGVTMIIHL